MEGWNIHKTWLLMPEEHPSLLTYLLVSQLCRTPHDSGVGSEQFWGGVEGGGGGGGGGGGRGSTGVRP